MARPEMTRTSPARDRFPEETNPVDETRRSQQRRERQLLKDRLLTAACLELDHLPPAGNAISEEDDSVDEKHKARFARIRSAIRAQGKLFAGQGTIVASWKTHQGKRLGPYYRVAYRVEGKQRSIYLGASEWLVAQVRGLLTSLQAPFREHCTIQRLKRQARQAFYQSKKHLARLLRLTLGAITKGWEFRGAVRALRRRGACHKQQANERRAAAAQRVIRGKAGATRGATRTDATCGARGDGSAA